MTMLGIDSVLAAHGLTGGGYKAGQRIHVPKLGLAGFSTAPLLQVDDVGAGITAVYGTARKNGYVYRIEFVSGSGTYVRKYAETNWKTPIWSYTLSTSTTWAGNPAISANMSGMVAVNIGNPGVTVVLNADGSLNRSLTAISTNCYSMALCANGDLWYTTNNGSTASDIVKNPNGSTASTNIYNFGTSSTCTSIIADETNQCVYFGYAGNNNVYKLAMSVASNTTPTVLATLSYYARCLVLSSSSGYLYAGTASGYVYKINVSTGAIVWSTQAITTANGWNQTGVSVGSNVWNWSMDLEQNDTGLWLTDSGRGIGKISCADGSSQLTLGTIPNFSSSNLYVCYGLNVVLQSDGHYNVYYSSQITQFVFSEWIKILP